MIFFLQIRNNELNKAVKKKLREKGLLLGNLDNDIVERRKRTVKYQTVYEILPIVSADVNDGGDCTHRLAEEDEFLIVVLDETMRIK